MVCLQVRSVPLQSIHSLEMAGSVSPEANALKGEQARGQDQEGREEKEGKEGREEAGGVGRWISVRIRRC